MKKHIFAPLILSTSLLGGCDNPSSNNNQSAVGQSIVGEFSQPATQTTKFIANAPELLRSIAATDLSANITIAGTSFTLNSKDINAGRWLIDLSLASNQTHNLFIEWFAGPHLVLEESGRFFADPATPTIKPQLDFISGGFPRFDADCDLFSNIDELIRGTDLLVADGTSAEGCTAMNSPDVPDPDGNFAWVVKQLRNFNSVLVDEPMTSYEQRIQIRTTQPDLPSGYSVAFIGSVDNENANEAKIEFEGNTEDGRRLRFRIENATDEMTADIAGAQCSRVGSEKQGSSCTIPYEWREEQWYAIRFEKAGDQRWQASVKSILSSTEQIIGTIDTAAGTEWTRAQVGMGHGITYTAEHCQLGLPLISMRFTSGVANNALPLQPNRFLKSPCLEAGQGSGEGVRTIDGELVYELRAGG